MALILVAYIEILVTAWPGATKDSIGKPKVHADLNIIGKLEPMGWWKPKRKIILPE